MQQSSFFLQETVDVLQQYPDDERPQLDAVEKVWLMALIATDMKPWLVDDVWVYPIHHCEQLWRPVRGCRTSGAGVWAR